MRPGHANGWWMLLGVLCFLCAKIARADEPLAAEIDRHIHAAQVRDKVVPAAPADDPEFVRRVYLDLVGRIPSAEEARRFCGSRDPDKRDKLIDVLLASGEFVQRWRDYLDGLLMGGTPFARNPQWRSWLEQCLRQNRGWDEMARAMLRARSDKLEDEGSSLFLLARFNQGPTGLDLATRDVSRFFFGVDIQCARCHKHPEVKQWKQERYWGMAAYYNRSYPLTVKGKLYLAERAAGELEFTPKGKAAVVARPVYLTGERLDEPRAQPKPAGKDGKPVEDPAEYLVPPEPAEAKTRVPLPKFSRRDKLVETAVNAGNPYFKRAAVNLVWQAFFGRGLVEPIDQMHEANPASHPELLQHLADDFAGHGFNLRRLMRDIVTSQTYQRSSHWPAGAPRPADEAYACAAVRPLSTQQLVLSVLTAAGHLDAIKVSAEPKVQADPGAVRARLEAQYTTQLAILTKALDGGEPFQPSLRVALFEANSPAFAEVIARGGLVGRLVALADERQVVHELFWGVLSRPPDEEEAERLAAYLRAHPERRPTACEQLVWALLTSSEFRFAH